MLSRRKFISGITLGSIGLAGLYSWQIEPYWVEYVQMPMPIKNLPENLVGATLVQLSDLHIGNRYDYQYQLPVFQKIISLKPEFVVYTGDYVTYESKEQFEQLKQVFKHAPLGKLGTYGVLGNHDYGKKWSQLEVADEVTAILNNSGIHMLRNQSIQSNSLNFTGLDDFWSPKFSAEILKEINDAQANLVLCHNPDALDLDVWNNYKGWILSGHTHGGQCKPPFLPPPLLPVKNKLYSSGKIDLKDGRTVYINRALGNLWPVRFNMRPEVTIFRLEKA